MAVNFMSNLPKEDSGGELVKAMIVPLGKYMGKKGEGKDVADSRAIMVLFNPKEYSIEKSVNWQSKGTVGKDGEHVEYTGADNETLSVELFCDTSRQNIDVRAFTDQIRALTQIDEELGHPRLVEFRWGSFSFRGVLTRLSQKFTHFNRKGVPVRATLNISFKESKPVWMQELSQRRQDYDKIEIIKYESDVIDRINKGDMDGELNDWGDGRPGDLEVDLSERPSRPAGGGGGPGGGGGGGGGPGGGGAGNPGDGVGHEPGDVRGEVDGPGGGWQPGGWGGPPAGPGGGLGPMGGGGGGGAGRPEAERPPEPTVKLTAAAEQCGVGEEITIKVEFEHLDEVTFQVQPSAIFDVSPAKLSAPGEIKVKGKKDGQAVVLGNGKGKGRAVIDMAKVNCEGPSLKLVEFEYQAG